MEESYNTRLTGNRELNVVVASPLRIEPLPSIIHGMTRRPMADEVPVSSPLHSTVRGPLSAISEQQTTKADEVNICMAL